MLLLATLGALGSSAPDWQLEYTLSPSSDLATLDVELCFKGNPAKRIEPMRGTAMPFISAAQGVDGGGIQLPAVGVNACTRYRVDLAGFARQHGGHSGATLAHGAMVTCGEVIFLRPALVRGPIVATARFVLPDKGMRVIGPFGISGPLRELDASVFTMTTRFVIGRFEVERLTVGGATIDVAILGGERRMTNAGIRRWITTAAEAAVKLFGRFPSPYASVIVRPTGQRGTLGHASAHHGGTGGVLADLGTNAQDDEMPGEWVLIHELLHLGMPYVEQSWLSEGFVTYYEEVVRGRAGILGEAEMWGQILDGVGRASRLPSGNDLARESRMMRQTARYSRVYWGGALVALALDVALRERAASSAKPPVFASLDDAMLDLATLCRSHQEFDALDVLAAWDRRLGLPFVAPLVTQLLKRTDFLDMSALLRRLGVRRGGDGAVILDNTAPLASIRRAIYTHRNEK